jgi:hypothetical protein
MIIRYQDKNWQEESIRFPARNPATPMSSSMFSRAVAGYTFLSNNIPII